MRLKIGGSVELKRLARCGSWSFKTFNMNTLLKFCGCISFIGTIVFSSCKKEKSCESCQTSAPSSGTNKPPIAIAGPDQVITLPTDSIFLDSSASNDPDGTISDPIAIGWLWTKISGHSSFTISDTRMSATTVKSLMKGICQFELRLTDNSASYFSMSPFIF